MNKKKEQEALIASSPVYWFVLMELSRDHGDFLQAAQAQSELERLGISVAYERKAFPSITDR